MAIRSQGRKPTREENQGLAVTPPNPSPPVPLGPSMGLTPTAPVNQGQLGVGPNSSGPFSGTAYGNPVNPDGSYNKPDGSYDWVEGAGPSYNWHGEDQKTGQAPIGTEPPYGAPPEQRQAWIQQNRAAGRTLADLGLEPKRAGGLSNFMRYANTPRGTAAPNPTQPLGTPVNPDGSMRGPISGGPVGIGAPVAPTPSVPMTPTGVIPGPGKTNPTPGLGAIPVNNNLGGLGTGLGNPNQLNQQRMRPVPSPTQGNSRLGMPGQMSSQLGGSMGLGGGSLYGQRRLY